MVMTKTGHFVQVWRPISPWPDRQDYIKFLGKYLAKNVSPRPRYWDRYGWQTISTEMPRRKARELSKTLSREGITSRVKFVDNAGVEKITDYFEKKA